MLKLNRVASFVICLFVLNIQFGIAQKGLLNAHAHNDYEHDRPLLDALSYGFASVEADVHLIDGELYVIHDAPASLEDVPTLKEAYLEPLWKRTLEGEEPVFANLDRPFLLMIDFKTKGKKTYKVLKEQLAAYQKMLNYQRSDESNAGPVLIFISGNRPIKKMMKDKTRMVGIDGRPNDLGAQYSTDLMPVISDSFRSQFSWNGEGAMPATEFEKLKSLVEKAHKEGKLIRFWAIPDQANTWEQLLMGGVDLINTDDLRGLRSFLMKKM